MTSCPGAAFLAGTLAAYTLLCGLLGALRWCRATVAGARTWLQIGAGLLIITFGLAELGVPGFCRIVVDPPASWTRLVRNRARSPVALAPAGAVWLVAGLRVSSDDVTWRFGNAAVDGVSQAGWLLGHFFPDEHDVRHTDAVEVKWAEQAAGDQRECWVTHERRTTLLLLVEGRFRITFSRGAVELRKRGDYAVWGPGVDHTWRAVTDSVVITVRWPSL